MLQKTSDINATDKTAKGIVNTLDPDNNSYNKNICTAAIKLVLSNRGNWEYLTQYSSGNSCWRNPLTDEREIIDIS